ncbi:MAG TPA: AAC(3) family N-acetyltransferase [Gaiellaceae bacterium]|nr:AAC(3) family N-acetyltransferase [Gaiellaceae bacterium]
MPDISADDVAAGLSRLEIAEHPVCLHSSLRSFGRVGGGADTVVDGFLAAGCTLVVPTYSWTFATQPVDGLRPPRNGWNYELPRAADGSPRVFTTDTEEIDGDMGAIPAAVVRNVQRVRGSHPLCSFSAVGGMATAAVGGQTWEQPYAQFHWLADNDGYVLLAGVGLTALTLIHYAEQLAGRTPFRRWVFDADGNVRTVPVGGCSNGFERLAPTLATLERRDSVGPSLWRCYPVRAALETLAAAIREQPELTRCANPACERCRDAIAGGPLL